MTVDTISTLPAIHWIIKKTIIKEVPFHQIVTGFSIKGILRGLTPNRLYDQNRIPEKAIES